LYPVCCRSLIVSIYVYAEQGYRRGRIPRILSAKIAAIRC
jgi:hypothetical protein